MALDRFGAMYDDSVEIQKIRTFNKISYFLAQGIRIPLE